MLAGSPLYRNGNVGFLLNQIEGESPNEITGVDLRLGLYDAELTGTVTTSIGSYAVRGLTHTNTDVIYVETDAEQGESIQITWHPEVPFSPVRKQLNEGKGPRAPNWDDMRNAPYPLPAEPVLSEADGIHFCYQELYDKRGETTTGWEIKGDPTGMQVFTTSIHHSFPEHNSLEVVKQNLLVARKMLADQNFFSSHQSWWHDYYPQSFLSVSDPEKEAFSGYRCISLPQPAGGMVLSLT